MSGPTLKLNVTSPGQQSVKDTTSAVKALAAALRDLPKASAELLKLQQALAGGSAPAKGGLKGNADDLKLLIGEIKNLGAQLNTSFLSLEETIKKGMGKSRKAYKEEARKTEEDIRESARRMAAAQALAQAEILSKAQAAGDRSRLKKASGSLDATRLMLYGSDSAGTAALRSFYQGILDREREAALRLEAEYQKSITKLDALVPKVIKAATREGYKPAGPAWWDEVLAKQKAAEAKLEAEYQKSITKLDALVPKVIKAATREGYKPAGPAWWDEVLAKQDAALQKMQVLNAKFAAMSPAGRDRAVLAGASRLAKGVAPDAVAAALGSDVLAAAQATSVADAYARVHRQVERGGKEASAAAPKFKLFSASISDAHSAARGLASGFGAMYLTWGRLMPLLAGAALSNSFVQSIKVGADVRQDLETVRVLSSESSVAVAGLERQLVSLGQNGPFGPREVAEAMKVLSLAGLSAEQVGASVKPALDLAVVGQTTIEKSASALVAVGTAYGYQAEQFGLVGDAMSKAAAISMSSVDGMMESFRSASVVGQQYKVSLNDTATALAILANVGIRNSAAGTAVRQMYSELSGASSNTRRAMKQLGVEVLDTATGGMKPLLTIVRELNAALSTKDAKAYQRAIQDLSNERGAKSVVALLEAFSAKAKEAGNTVENELQRIQNAIANAPGFSAISSAQLSATPLNQMKATVSSFQTALFEAFKSIEPLLLVLTARMKAAFASPEFRETIASLASAVGNFTAFLVDNAKALLAIAAGYAAWKGASIGLSAVTLLVEANTAAHYRNAVASGASAAAATTAAAASRAAWLSALGPVGLVLGAVASLWTVYQATTAEATAGATDAARVRNDIVLQSLTDEAARLDEVNDKLRERLGLERQYRSGKADMEAEGLSDEYARSAKRLQFLTAKRDRVKPGGVVYESLTAELERERSNSERLQREMYDYGRRIGEGVSAVARKSAENAALGSRTTKVFGTEGVDTSREDAEKARKESAANARINSALEAVRREYRMRETFIKHSHSQEDQLTEAWHAANAITDEQYEAKKLESAERLHAKELANLKNFVDRSKVLIAQLKNDPRAAAALTELAVEAEEKARDAAFLVQKAAAEASKLRQEAHMKSIRKLLGDKGPVGPLPMAPENEPAQWALNLFDWGQTEKLLRKTQNEFMDGFIERGRSMWAEWLNTGKLSFRSLKDLVKQTFADITYKRFISGPLSKFGESLFDNLLKPTAQAKPGTGEFTSNLKQAFDGLAGTAMNLGQKLAGFGQDFWRLLVQFGQGLASMLSSGSGGGVGGFFGRLFGGSGGAEAEYIDVLGLNAKGNAFNRGVYAFANGGLPTNSVISSPYFFKFGAGGSKLGVAGEAGPEAIMPLERGAGGRLGVRSYGGGGGGNVTNVSVVVEKHGDGNGPVTQSRETQPDGSELIRVVLNATAKDISRGGTVRKSMQSVAGRKNLPRY